MTHEQIIEFWGFDPEADAEKGRAVARWLSKQGPTVWAALIAAATLVVLGVGDLTSWRLPKKLGGDQIFLLVLSQAVLIVLVYSVIDEVGDRRARRRWEETSGPLIATLRLNMMFTQQRMDHALRHTDDDHTWEALAKSADWFQRLVQTSLPLVVVHPDLAAFAPRFLTVASRLADRAGAVDPRFSVRNVANDRGVQNQTEMLRTEVQRLAADTALFEEIYGALGEPGAAL